MERYKYMGEWFNFPPEFSTDPGKKEKSDNDEGFLDVFEVPDFGIDTTEFDVSINPYECDVDFDDFGEFEFDEGATLGEMCEGIVDFLKGIFGF